MCDGLVCSSACPSMKREPFLYDYILKHQNLNRTDIIRDLGVLLDTKLIFDYHIDAIVTKAFKALGFIIRTTVAGCPRASFDLRAPQSWHKRPALYTRTESSTLVATRRTG
ncbi:jg19198 [Pararge aegeria aegeria]|uniref:Jg19198 protein n=1 Tax=Pararge aegeria aegeria TaxID=348720 RepID=A0A8S4SQQ4_9NEOP|nr:jg19198 [Pararge aegeria aegeria]